MNNFHKQLLTFISRSTVRLSSKNNSSITSQFSPTVRSYHGMVGNESNPTSFVVDLRSDTITKPSTTMRTAMAQAEVGDDVYEEDATVKGIENELKRYLKSTSNPHSFLTAVSFFSLQLWNKNWLTCRGKNAGFLYRAEPWPISRPLWACDVL